MNYGDHMLHALAVQAGATYGQGLISARTEYVDATANGCWGMEIWSRFEVEVEGGGPSVHYMAGSLEQNLLTLLRETITVDAEV